MKTLYRLRAPVLALKLDDTDNPNLQPLPDSAVVIIVGDVRDSGLVDVRYTGEIYIVFYSDVVERGEVVKVRAEHSAVAECTGKKWFPCGPRVSCCAITGTVGFLDMPAMFQPPDPLSMTAR